MTFYITYERKNNHWNTVRVCKYSLRDIKSDDVIYCFFFGNAV